MSALYKLPKPVALIFNLLVMLCSAAGAAFAQSTDINFPSPVRTNELVGSIAARDLGDARRTDHFYAFVGNPGDLLITVQSNNLNGDVDVFTAGSLRPLMKFTLYAESSLPITKSVYLRRRQDLVLRVEARTPNDDEGMYQVRFGGSFEPLAGENLLTANENPAPDTTADASPTRDKNTRRVSSVGARIPDPRPTPVEEIAAATPTAEPSPEPTPADTTTSTETPAAAAPKPRTESATPVRAPRRTRGKGPARRRAPTIKAAPKDETVATSETEEKPKPAESPQEPEPQTGPRLIIEMQDGTRIERYMSTVKRVTVENNQIVVVNKLGRIERVRLSEVARMTIEP